MIEVQLGEHLIGILDVTVDEKDDGLLYVDYNILSGDPNTFDTSLVNEFILGAIKAKIKETLGD